LIGEYYENQFVKIWIGECYHRRRRLDNLLAARLDDAGSNDEYDHESLSYGDGQVRLCAFANRRYLGTYWMEFIRGNFRVDFSDDLQLVNQGLKT